MKAAAERPDEAAVLAVLHGLDVLDSEAEPVFDALVRAASTVCGTPISLVSLVDADRQWFKANIGLPDATQTPRDIAFCAHAVLGPTLFEVPDACDDPRFHDNPLVRGEPNIRFYAGVPLQLSGGERVGTLCVIDRQPRQLDAAQREVLQCLGLAAAKALEGRRAMREMAVSAALGMRLANIQSHSTDAIIGLDLEGRILRWNPAAQELFGHHAEAMLGANVAILAPPGLGSEEADAAARLVDHKSHTYETVRRHANGRLIDVSITAVPEFDGAGRLLGSTKFVRDISERVQLARQKEASAQRARRMYESTPAMLHSADRDGRLVAVSDRWLAVLGYDRSEVIGRVAADLLTPAPRQRSLHEVLPKLFAGGRVDDVEYQIVARDGRVLDVLLSAVLEYGEDGEPQNSLSVMQDITERRRAERELSRTRYDLQKVLDAVPSLLGYWDAQLVNRMANHAYSEWFDIDEGGVHGRTLPDVLGQDLFEINRPFVEATLRGVPQTFEYAIQRRDGQGVRHALAHYMPDVVDGEVRGFYVLVHDVTDLVESRLRLAAAQRATDALLRTVHQHAIVSTADRSGRITEVNEAFCAISGYSRDELIGRDHRILHSGEQPAAFWTEMWRTVSQGKAWRSEVCNRAKDGSLYWVDSIISPFVDGRGEVEQYISIRFDITAAKRAEQQLRYSKAFLDRAGQIAGVGGWELDLRTQAIHWSAQTHRIHEVEADYVPELAKAIQFYAADARPAIQRAVEDSIRDGNGWDLELPFVTGRGRQIWVRTVGEAEFEDGQAVRLIGAFQDITQRKRAEHTLAQERQLMSSLLATLPDQIYFKDRDSRFLRINPTLARRYGLSDPAEAVGKSDGDFFSPEHAAVTAAIERRIVDTGVPVIDLEEEELWPDRPPTWNLTTKMPLKDVAGQIIGTFGVSRDITARRQTEAELRATMTLLNAVLDSATQASIIAVRPDGLVSVFNAGAQQMLGYEADEVVGRLSSLEFHDRQELRERAAELSEQFGRKVRTGLVLVEPEQLGRPQDWSYRRKDGSRVPVSLAVTAMRDAGGELFGYLGIAHDVSRQKAQERELKHAVEQAGKASLAKSQFLANMSHEIRTPMNAVIGLSYLLERTALDAEQADTLRKIKVASTSLLSIINDVLDLSKIEAAEMQIERAPFMLDGVLSELTMLSQLQADAKGVTFSVEAEPGLPQAVVGDATRLRQVLTNLLSNAIKFTERGAVRMSVSLLRREGDDVRLAFVVRDSGIGIAPDALPRLFTPFVQADTSTTRRFGGTGLGLSIVKQLVTLMGGEVSVVSTPHRGSEFRVELDFPVCSDSAFSSPQMLEQSVPGPGLNGVNVLVADDSPINLEVARRILELEGARVWLAQNGQEAVDYLLSSPGSVDVVLMDVQMPVLDGHDATRRIRSGLGMTKLPVIALTAGNSTGEHASAVAAGMNDVVAKPFDPRMLVRCIQRHVRGADMATVPALSPVEEDTAEWPPMPGIEAREVSARLGGDIELFGSLMRRLLRDFGDLADVAVTPAELAGLAARMHDLKGSAGTLGARSLATLAGQAEDACRARDIDSTPPLMRRIATALDELDRASETMLQAAPAGTDEAAQDPRPGPVDPAALAALAGQLASADLAALGSFRALAPHLQRLLGPREFGALRQSIDDLDFAAAASALQGR